MINLQELLSDNTGWATGCRQRNSQPWLSPPSETLPAVATAVAEGLTGAFERGALPHVCVCAGMCRMQGGGARVRKWDAGGSMQHAPRQPAAQVHMRPASTLHTGTRSAAAGADQTRRRRCSAGQQQGAATGSGFAHPSSSPTPTTSRAGEGVTHRTAQPHPPNSYSRVAVAKFHSCSGG